MAVKGISPSFAAALLAMTIAGTTVRARADEVWDKEPKGINPATGAPANAPKGCCCIPKLHATASDGFDCKGMVAFDCKAECAQLKDGRDPSGCKWTKGDCPR
jgi:hypothetical protein